eukprot:jgi/Botrbrau1/8541/Bobra.0359s0006.1
MTGAVGNLLFRACSNLTHGGLSNEGPLAPFLSVLIDFSQRLTDTAPSVRRKTVQHFAAIAEVLADNPLALNTLRLVFISCFPQLKAFLMACTTNEDIHPAKDIIALCGPFTNVPSNCVELLLLVKTFPKLATVFPFTRFGAAFEGNSFGDWISFTAALTFDQVSFLARHVDIPAEIAEGAFRLLRKWLESERMTVTRGVLEGLPELKGALNVAILSKTWSGRPDSTSGEVAILLHILAVLISGYIGPSKSSLGRGHGLSPREDQYCFEISLDDIKADVLPETEAVSTGDKPDPCAKTFEEVQQCVCGVLHCLLVALQNGLENKLCPSLLSTVDCFFAKRYMAINAIGEEPSDLLLQVVITRSTCEEALNSIFSRHLIAIRSAGPELPLFMLLGFLRLFQALAICLRKKYDAFKETLQKQRQEDTPKAGDLSGEGTSTQPFDYMEGEDQGHEDDVLAYQYLTELVCTSCAAPYYTMLLELALADTLQLQLRVMALRGMGSMAVLTEGLAADFLPALLKLLSSNATPDSVKQQAFASASALVAKWPTLDLSERILHEVGSGASTDDVPSNREAAALAFKDALLQGTVKVDAFLSHISMGLINEDLLVKTIFVDLLQRMLDGKGRSRPQLLVDLFSCCPMECRSGFLQVLQQRVFTKEDTVSEQTASPILQSFMKSRVLAEQASFAAFLSLLTPSARLLGNLLRYLQDRESAGTNEPLSRSIAEHLRVFVQNFKVKATNGEVEGQGMKANMKSKTVMEGVLNLLQHQSQPRVRKRKCTLLSSPQQEGLDKYRAEIDSFRILQEIPMVAPTGTTLGLMDIFAGIES